MVFKINIGTKDGKTYKLEAEAESLLGMKLGDKVQGQDVLGDLAGYELEIKGFSDKSGFTGMEDVEGVGLKKVLLGYGKAMKKRPKYEGKRKRADYKPKGLRLRKTVRGNTISEVVVQINLKVLKEGGKKFSEVFPDQNKKAEAVEDAVNQETKVEEKPVENKE